MSPASELVLWCVRRVAGDVDTAPPLEDMARADWAELMRTANAQGVLAVAWLALRPFIAAIEDEAAAELRLAYESNARRNLMLVGELRSVAAALAGRGIGVVTWKGPVLAQRAYGDLAARQFYDLDLLLRRADLVPAQRALGGLGFQAEKKMTDHEQATYVDHQGELELVRPSDGLWVELHTAVMPTYYGRGPASDEWWRRTVGVDIGRVQVTALDPVDELHALCVHGSKHRWSRLVWILDVALMASHLDGPQWTALLSAARGQGTRRMLHLGLLLAADLCAARIPTVVLGEARADHVARALAHDVAATLFEPRGGRFDGLMFHARMRERGRDQLRYLLSVAFTPSGADWDALHLPRPLFPLYAVTRPVRLAAKYGRRLVSPPRSDGPG